MNKPFLILVVAITCFSAFAMASSDSPNFFAGDKKVAITFLYPDYTTEHFEYRGQGPKLVVTAHSKSMFSDLEGTIDPNIDYAINLPKNSADLKFLLSHPRPNTSVVISQTVNKVTKSQTFVFKDNKWFSEDKILRKENNKQLAVLQEQYKALMAKTGGDMSILASPNAVTAPILRAGPVNKSLRGLVNSLPNFDESDDGAVNNNHVTVQNLNSQKVVKVQKGQKAVPAVDMSQIDDGDWDISSSAK